MVILPDSEKDTALAETGLEIEFFDCENRNVLCLSSSKSQSKSKVLYQFQEPEGSRFEICSARVDRAEGGLVVEIYEKDQAEPAATVSFALDIHKRSGLVSLLKNSNANNVQVCVRDPQKSCITVDKVVFDRPFPFYIL